MIVEQRAAPAEATRHLARSEAHDQRAHDPFDHHRFVGPDTRRGLRVDGTSVGYGNGGWTLPRTDGGTDLAAVGRHGQVMLVSAANDPSGATFTYAS